MLRLLGIKTNQLLLRLFKKNSRRTVVVVVVGDAKDNDFDVVLDLVERPRRGGRDLGRRKSKSTIETTELRRCIQDALDEELDTMKPPSNNKSTNNVKKNDKPTTNNPTGRPTNKPAVPSSPTSKPTKKHNKISKDRKGKRGKNNKNNRLLVEENRDEHKEPLSEEDAAAEMQEFIESYNGMDYDEDDSEESDYYQYRYDEYDELSNGNLESSSRILEATPITTPEMEEKVRNFIHEKKGIVTEYYTIKTGRSQIFSINK